MLLLLIFFAIRRYYLAPHGSIFFSVVQPLIAKLILNEDFIGLIRWIRRTCRVLWNKPATIHLFIAADDSHSYMLLQALPSVVKQYPDVNISVRVVSLGLSSWSIGKDAQLKWAIKDCSLFAALYNLLPPLPPRVLDASGKRVSLLSIPFGDNGLPTDTAVAEYLRHANQRMAQQVADMEQRSVGNGGASAMQAALACMQAIWGSTAVADRGDAGVPTEGRYNLRSRAAAGSASIHADHTIALAAGSATSKECLQQGQAHVERNTALLRRLGYYGPGIIEFEGEWYQLGRLHHLEHRLRSDSSLYRRTKAEKSCVRSGEEAEESTRRAETMPHFSRELEGHGVLYAHYSGGNARAAHANPLAPVEPQQTVESSLGAELKSKHSAKSTPSCKHAASTTHTPVDESADGVPDIEVFYSFRSPYSQLVLDRLQRLCDLYARSGAGAGGDPGGSGQERTMNIVVRPLLPMVRSAYCESRSC
jgi:hypothetical protein